MLLKTNELLSRNMTGFKFGIREQRMTMTSRSAWETDYYVVLSDDGEYCLVGELGNHKRTNKWDRTKVAKLIEYSPALKWDSKRNANVNDIDQAVVKEAVDLIHELIDELQSDIAYYIKSDSPHRAAKYTDGIQYLKDKANRLINENILA